jgi:glycosyltransferase involved in cell wall biosynthesis
MNNLAGKIPKLEKIAQLQPNVTIICPTKSLVDVFKSAGFANTHVVPYPIANKRVLNRANHTVEFKSVLFAGAAREDKGFSKFVQLISHAHERKLSVPFTIQISSDHKGEHDAETRKNIALLKSIPYPYLNIYDQTLSTDAYAKMFEGVICVQLYRSNDFADRVSGVTLDALAAGCPIITTEGTWIANQVTRFGAGIVVDSSSPECVHVAINKIIENYNYYRSKSVLAGEVLQKEHSSVHLAKILIRD